MAAAASVTVPDSVPESVVTLRVLVVELPWMVVVTGCLSCPRRPATNGRTGGGEERKMGAADRHETPPGCGAGRRVG